MPESIDVRKGDIMSFLPPPPEKNVAAKRWIPVLLIGIVGIFAIVGLFATTPDLRLIEFTPLLLIVVFSAWGYLRGFVRGVLTIVIIYLSTAVAGLFYRAIAPFVGAVLEVMRLNLNASVEDAASLGDLAFTFSLLTAILWILLEIVRRATFQAPELSQLGILDNILGVLVHLVLGILIASLLFNVVGYGDSRPRHDRAHFRPTFNQVVYAHYLSQSFWFGRNPPPIYTYDLDAR
jgi:uncharacterized membrane protein required for colicin V production